MTNKSITDRTVLLCLGCRTMFGPSALRAATNCPDCGHQAFLRPGREGGFTVVRLDQHATEAGVPAPRPQTR